MTTHLVWFRNDLRVHDNYALSAACRSPEARVVALFIATPRQWELHHMAPRQAELINQQLNALGLQLAERGITLHIRQQPDFSAEVDEVKRFCQQHSVDALFYNYQYEVNERARDARLERELDGQVICQGFDDSLLLPPGAVVTGNREMYKVFTPFSRAFIKRLKEQLPDCVAAPAVRCEAVAFTPYEFDYPRCAFNTQHFPADERGAISQLRTFCQNSVAHYGEQRDFPAINGTSCLSAALATGVLSPRQCLYRLLKEHPEALDGEGGASIWLNELIWREFYRHLLVAYPRLCRFHPFIPWTDKVRWNHNPEALSAWQQGKTGYPIVDAAMRQLNQTGWMHNRLRMVAASFLVKDLLIDWREGERYFMSQLIDGDLAANNGGWQWAASTGTDAAPYFRIFNPTTQGQRFDSDGAFIRQWLPELAMIPGKQIHTPWEWADKQRQTLDYPRPIVDHKQARIATLAAYEAARQ